MTPIGFFRPDLAETNPGVSAGVLNAIIIRDASGVSYAPHPSISVLSTAVALPAAPRGIVSVVTRTGGYQVYAGTVDNLYKIAADGSYTEIGTGYTVPSGDNWSMQQFGDYLYVTNTFDGMLRYNIESGGSVTAVSGAPVARIIFPLFGAMAALDCDGNNRLMKTSKINDPTVWSGDASNTYQEFVDGEELMGGGEISGAYAVVFQRNAVRVLTNTRDRSIFTANQLEGSIGATSADSIVVTRGWAYFVDTNGFQRTNGQVIEPIGEDKVSSTFIKSLASNASATVQGAYDPFLNRVLFRYQKSSVTSTTVFEDVLAYHISIGEWMPLALQTASLVTMATPGYSLEDLDAFGTLDTLPYSLDSRVWKGGEATLAAVNGDLKFGFMSGANMACTLEIGMQTSPQSLLIRSAIPVTDSANATVQLGVKDSLSDTITWKTATSIAASGRAMLRGRGKAFSLRLNVPASETWTYMRGFDAIDAVSGGPR